MLLKVPLFVYDKNSFLLGCLETINSANGESVTQCYFCTFLPVKDDSPLKQMSTCDGKKEPPIYKCGEVAEMLYANEELTKRGIISNGDYKDYKCNILNFLGNKKASTFYFTI